jgi:excisionase family DNA binding protein
VPDFQPALGLPARLLTADDVARTMNISLRSVRRLIADKKLATIRIGRAVRIRTEALERLIAGE